MNEHTSRISKHPTSQPHIVKMFRRQINYEKLRSKLRVCVHHIDSMLNRKKVRALKKRKEIIKLVRTHKKKKARTCVEQIIPIDCLIEAGDILKQLCLLLLEKFDFIQKSDFLDGNLVEAIYCITWAATYLKHEVAELEVVAHLLISKYGKLCKSFKHRNLTYENLKRKLILARSGQWLSPKIVEDYLVELTKNYESREIGAPGGDKHPKGLTHGDQWRIGFQTIAQPPRVSNNGKVGYRRPSVGNYVTERPWTTLDRRPRKHGSSSVQINIETSQEFNTQRLSRIPRPISHSSVNSKVFRSNSLNDHYKISMNSINSFSGSLTSLKSSNSSTLSMTSVFVEEYVSILDHLFNFDKAVTKNDTLAEEPDLSEKMCNDNWGNYI